MLFGCCCYCYMCHVKQTFIYIFILLYQKTEVDHQKMVQEGTLTYYYCLKEMKEMSYKILSFIRRGITMNITMNTF